ncbi:cystathionine beta-lyase [Parabacteroides sp. PF5-5]|uniref:MalY/PatB family protein n=1 Tax=unclassified Parabacteroides TaxID=2649774 RepID=UPI0024767C89|nr:MULTISPECIES: PatB family C-S lyase [unclassified Parabacteroides]MDH6306432.1 cystathionine beta-lyase [Parabacteroides sp. PH5-39]MDH6317416.1 cystathionine beta-lyase [Parabacteroides sp. PF5-13]MDH6321143.1 cystathionine beta-lyase [Parabacteroides sp. PH5-13]MDH6324875.1 cystathionine beta-lyase [Parabacteroides sp. PH5-8]MDH6328601.1 cystathionine beta-lyase [Parabacteroides sp. PH5-41]
MKQYNFDEIINRKGTNCIKVDALETVYGKADLTPLWVADMDFRTPDFIVDALKKRCAHEVFGYTFASDDYYHSIIRWLNTQYAWEIKKEWLSYIPGIVKGIAFVLDCFTRPGDKVIIQPPVYHPFRLVPEAMQREVVYNPLKQTEGAYEMDFDQLESIIDEKCKVLILSNPHNPGGIVWTKETLARLAEICARHQVLVVSDEIHSEMVYPPFRHYPFPSVSETAASCSITFMAPSKTFNIAGIVTSYAIIPDDLIREKFYTFLEARELSAGTIFAYEATRAAYTYGEEWRKQMLQYVMQNVDYVANYMAENIPQIKVYKPQASFLVWLDCRELGLSRKELVSLFVNDAGLALNDGAMFGSGGEGYMRMNVGCPRAVLERSLPALKEAIRHR